MIRSLLALPFGYATAEEGGFLWGVMSTIEEATGFGVGSVTAFGAGGTVLLVVVALAVLRRVASLVISLEIVAGLLAWWAGWLT